MRLLLLQLRLSAAIQNSPKQQVEQPMGSFAKRLPVVKIAKIPSPLLMRNSFQESSDSVLLVGSPALEESIQNYP